MISCVIDAAETLDIDIRVQYNESIDPSKAQDAKRSVNKQLAEPPGITTISITGMTCSSCTDTVERALTEFPGVERVSVSLLTHKAMVIHGPNVRIEDLRKCVEDCGFEATAGKRTAGESAELLRQKKELTTLKNSFYKLSWSSSLLSLVNNNSRMFRYISLRRLLDRILTPWGTQVICFCITMLIWGRYGAWMHRSTWARAKKGSTNMNTLVTLSSTLGILLSLMNLFYQAPGKAETYWQTTAGLIMVITAGKYVNVLARRTGTKALASLYSLIEETSWVKLSDTKVSCDTPSAKCLALESHRRKLTS